MRKIIIFFILFCTLQAEAQSSALEIGDQLMAQGYYAKAIETYNSLKNINDVSHKIAKAYIALGNYDKALDHYKNRLDSSPNDITSKYEYAKLLSKVKKYDHAAELFEQLSVTDSLNPNFHYELGLILEQQKDSLAHNRFKKAFDLDNTHQKAIFKIAKRHLRKRQFEVVKKYVNIGLNSYANNRELISLKAQNYYWHEDYENAKVWFEKLLELGENSQFIREKLSFCFKRIYDYPNAILHQKEALKFDSKNATNLYILANLYDEFSDFENAEKYYKASLLLQDVPLDHEYVKLASALNRQSKHEEAIKVFNKAIRENPENHHARFFLIYTKDKYYKDLDTKIKLYQDYKDKYPKSPYLVLVDRRLKELKEEKFLKKD